MYGYIYLTTNLINGKQYVGKHKSNKFLGEQYLGSGRLFLDAVKKYGRNNFKVELIDECETLEELNEKEIYWIDYFDAVKSRDFYNIHPGGGGGDISLYMSKEDVDTIRKNHSKYITDRINSDADFKSKFVGAKDGHKVTDSTKTKIGNSQKKYWDNVNSDIKHKRLSHTATIRNTGRVWITNDEIDKFVNKCDIDNYLSNGFRLGRKFKPRNKKCATTIESIGNEKDITE